MTSLSSDNTERLAEGTDDTAPATALIDGTAVSNIALPMAEASGGCCGGGCCS